MQWRNWLADAALEALEGDERLRKRRAARWAGWLFLFGAIISVLGSILFAATWGEVGLRSVVTLSLLGLVAGMWGLPWPRWPLGALAAVVPAAFGVILLHEWLAGFTPYIYPLTFVLIYVWVGLALPRWAPWALSPLLVLTFVLPKLGDTAALTAAAIAVPTCLLVGEAISIAMHRQRRYREQLNRRAEVFHRVARVAREISSLDSKAVLDEVVAACRQLGFDVACLARITQGGEAVELTSVSGVADDGVGQLHSLDIGIAGEVHRRGKAVEWHRREIAEQGCPMLSGSGLGSVYAEPVWLDGALEAVLVVGRHGEETISTDERTAVEILALEAEAALSNAERFASEQRQVIDYRDKSMKDALTGLGNRRLLDALMEALAPEDAVLALDLDHFKWVNDHFGHDRGDEVLVALAEFLRNELREGDVAVRYGGEEFIVVMPRAGESAEQVACRLLERWRDSEPVTTFSLGLALHRPEVSQEETLKRADEALYAAKRAGRNRLSMAH